MAADDPAGAVQATRRRAWLVAGFAVWLVAGVYLVSWALAHGLTADVAVSPFHVLGYAGLATLLIVVLALATRAVRVRRPPFAGGLEPLPIAVALLVAYVVGDQVWAQLVGPQEGIEGSLSPTRVLLPLALGILALAPLAIATRASGAARRAATLPAVVGIAAAGPAISLALLAMHPIVAPWTARPLDAGIDDTEIWTMAADGSRQQRVIRAGDGVEASLASWSPDGTQVAWTRWTAAGDGTQDAEVWLSAADGGGAHPLTGGAASDWIPAWSPDGTWIAFTAEPATTTVDGAPQAPLPEPGRAPGGAPAAAEAGSDLWLIRPDGTEHRRLTSLPGGEYVAAWSPDGSRIAFGNQLGEAGDLHVVDVATGAVGPLVVRDGFDWSPSWSPDGTELVFESDAAGGTNVDLWIVGADGSGLRQLTRDPGWEAYPRWSPDGATIAYVSDATGDGEIWAIAPDGSNARNLTASPHTGDGYWGLDWTRDGATLLYASAPHPAAAADPLVRHDLAAAGVLLRAAVLAVLAVLLVRVGPPFGAFAVLLGVDTAFGAALSDEWGFVPTAIVAGLVVDLAVRQSTRWRTVVAGAATAAAATAAQAVTLLALGTSGWTGTLWIGVGLAGALLGALIGWLAMTAARDPRPQPVDDSA